MMTCAHGEGFAPLRITAHLASAVAYHPDETVSLDGPLLYAVMLERHGEQLFGPFPGTDVVTTAARDPDAAMPLSGYRPAADLPDAWCYCVSSAEPVGHAGTETLHWHSRFDDVLAQQAIESGALAKTRGGRVVNTASGEFRSQRRPLYVEHVAALTWYAVGDPAETLRLLAAHVTHLGKRRNTGHGAVSRWTVVPWDGDPLRWCWRDAAHTVPARPLPLDWCPGWTGATSVRAVRPPAWCPEHWMPCAVAS